ncbi:MAG: hypothetical protein ACRDP6_14890 [Actinoallomurus sp.]
MLTDSQLAEIEARCENAGGDLKASTRRRAHIVDFDVPRLLAEVKRLRLALKDAADQVAEADHALGAATSREISAQAEVKRLTARRDELTALLNNADRLTEHLRQLQQIDATPSRTLCQHCGQVILRRSTDGVWFSKAEAVPVTSDCNDAPDGVHAPAGGGVSC